MSQPIPWSEWEAEARRLHHALSGHPLPTALSGAKHLLARLLGHAHWHEVEQHLKARNDGEQEPPSEAPVTFPEG